MSRRLLVIGAFLIPLAGSAAEAQVAGRERPAILRPGRRAEAVRDQQPPARRLALEAQIRRGFWRVVKQRVGFNDEQMLRLERTTQRFDERRRALGQQERAQRVALRAEVVADSSANQASIAAALEQLQQLQRQRLDLQGEEQKELASFMTPLQRAKYFALQEQVRRRLQEAAKDRPDNAAVPDAP